MSVKILEIDNKKKIQKEYSLQFLPESLLDVSKNKTIYYNQKKLKVSYIVDISHNLILKYYFKKENKFHLSSTILKEKYGFLYNYYINYLIDNNIIELVKNYMSGKNTRVYKISQDILDNKIYRNYKNKDKVLLKKYDKAISLVENKNELIYNIILPDIKKKLVSDLFDIDIEYTKSVYFLDNTIQDKDTYNKNMYSVESINDKHIFYHFDTYGRMHTNFTILKSFIRKNCLLINGSKTYEIDIKNSQPSFLCKLISEDFDYIKDIDKAELIFFKHLTDSGKFYQYIIDNSHITQKSDAKKLVYKVFFGKNYKNSNDDIFKELFPSIYKYILYFKRKENSYKSLSHKLQKMESNLLYNKIIKKVVDLCPDIKIISIHDSIIFEEKYKDVVNIIFNDNIKKEFSIEI